MAKPKLNYCVDKPSFTCAERTANNECPCAHCRHFVRVWRLGYAAGLKAANHE